jgi:hypothetical protein
MCASESGNMPSEVYFVALKTNGSVYVYVCMYVCMYACACVRACVCVCVCVCCAYVCLDSSVYKASIKA